MTWPFLIAVFAIATCGLVYELLAGTLASYLLGDSVTQFSTIIGTYLFAMGVGSWLSGYITRQLHNVFVRIEILVGVVGGFSAPVLFLSFDLLENFRLMLYSLVFMTGCLVGLEIPLMMRLLKEKVEFKFLVSRVLTFDYVGALFASLLFPWILVPHLGLVRSSLMFGMINVAVAFWTIHLFRHELVKIWSLRFSAAVAMCALGLGWAHADNLTNQAELASYPEPVVYAATTPYQHIVITSSGGHYRLYLNRNLQFDSRDEHRYHESLVHPALSAVEMPGRVLVLGGGDGLALREVLKYPTVTKVVLVDLDEGMTRLFTTQPHLRSLNQSSLSNPKVAVVNEDAFIWVRRNRETFDVIVVDFPDPSNFSLGKLYTDTFYRHLNAMLAPGGVICVQSTSPYVAPRAFSSIAATLRAAGFLTTPYHVHVPSFGEWGFVLASRTTYTAPAIYPTGLKFLDPSTFEAMCRFPPDMLPREGQVNRLQDQILVRHFDEEWGSFAR